MQVVGSGEVSHAIGVASTTWVNPDSGSANVMIATAFNATAGWNTLTPGANRAASNVQIARMYAGSIPGASQANLTIGKAIGLHTINGWAPGVIGGADRIGARYAVLNEDAGTAIETNGNVNITGNLNMAAFRETVSSLGSTSGSLTPNTRAASVFTVTATGDITINGSDLPAMYVGQSITIIITQDSTGGRLLTSDMKFAGASKTLSTAANAIDVLNVFYDGTNYLASLVKGYA